MKIIIGDEPFKFVDSDGNVLISIDNQGNISTTGKLTCKGETQQLDFMKYLEGEK